MKRRLQIAFKGFISAITGFFAYAHAHCPLCTAAVGSGVAITRFYGIDDSVVGVWIGAFIVSTTLWAATKIKKEYVPFQNYVLVAVAFLITVFPFYYVGLIGDLRYTIFGIDKLLLGMLTGSVVTLVSFHIGNMIKKRVIPFQKIVITLGSLAIVSGLFLFISQVMG